MAGEPLVIQIAEDLPRWEDGAALADKKAEILTDKEWQGQQEDQPCSICKGTGQSKIKQVEEGKPDKWSSMTCYECDGKGTQNADQCYASLYHNNVWCKCKDEAPHVVAVDGRKVFGNDTYLCSHCGMVVQFG